MPPPVSSQRPGLGASASEKLPLPLRRADHKVHLKERLVAVHCGLDHCRQERGAKTRVLLCCRLLGCRSSASAFTLRLILALALRSPIRHLTIAPDQPIRNGERAADPGGHGPCRIRPCAAPQARQSAGGLPGAAAARGRQAAGAGRPAGGAPPIGPAGQPGAGDGCVGKQGPRLRELCPHCGTPSALLLPAGSACACCRKTAAHRPPRRVRALPGPGQAPHLLRCDARPPPVPVYCGQGARTKGARWLPQVAAFPSCNPQAALNRALFPLFLSWLLAAMAARWWRMPSERSAVSRCCCWTNSVPAHAAQRAAGAAGVAGQERAPAWAQGLHPPWPPTPRLSPRLP